MTTCLRRREATQEAIGEHDDARFQNYLAQEGSDVTGDRVEYILCGEHKLKMVLIYIQRHIIRKNVLTKR